MNAILMAISAILPAITTLLEYVEQLRARGRQSGELTPEQDAALDAEIARITSKPWWTPENKP